MVQSSIKAVFPTITEEKMEKIVEALNTKVGNAIPTNVAVNFSSDDNVMTVTLDSEEFEMLERTSDDVEQLLTGLDGEITARDIKE